MDSTKIVHISYLVGKGSFKKEENQVSEFIFVPRFLAYVQISIV